ncbi:DUF883 family protein [Bradyrhizobium sp. Tv2a-2]|uniref:DUF883 family protein n=1 Tax=Bradyrhizobium sp. Tv2a-2 TaxID=113395 RepID=UPI00040FDCE5|nr:DUF883 family protein [Bradyrhizobium sp. Tv2a-2]
MASADAEILMRNTMGDAAYDRLEKDVIKVKRDIADLTDHITDTVNALGDAARRQARRGYKQAMDDLSERSGAMMDAAQDAAASVEERLEDIITQRPLATVGLALGLGLLIGMSWRR